MPYLRLFHISRELPEHPHRAEVLVFGTDQVSSGTAVLFLLHCCEVGLKEAQICRELVVDLFKLYMLGSEMNEDVVGGFHEVCVSCLQFWLGQ